MADNIERIGVQAVVENINAFMRDMRNYRKAIGDSSKSTEISTKSSKSLGTAVEGMAKRVSSSIPGFNLLDGAMGGISGTSLIAAAGVAALGAAILKVSQAGLQAFGEFQKGTNEVFTLLPGISRSAMGSVRSDLQQFDNQLGLLSKESIPALYQAISAGVPRQNAFEFLTVAQKTAKGGVTDLSTAIDAITTVVNGYGASVISATRASDLMFTAVRLGKTKISEISASLSQITPITSQAGIGFEYVTAAIATLTAQGVPTSTAVNQLRQAIVQLQRPTSKAAQFFQQISGKTFTDFIKQGGTVKEAFDLIAASAAKSNIPMAALFTRIEGANAILGLTGSNAARFGEALDAMGASAGATEAAFNQMNQGLIPATQRLQAVANTILEQIGSLLEPILTPIIEVIASVGRGFSGILHVVQELVGFFFGPLIDAWNSLGGAIVFGNGLVTGFINIVADGIHILTGLRDSIIGTIVGTIKAPFDNLFNQVKTTFNQLITVIGAYIPEFFKGAGRIAGSIASGFLQGANQYVFPVIIDIATFIADFLSGFSPPKRGPLSTIDEGAANVMKAWTEGFTSAFSITPVKDIASSVNAQLGNIGKLGVGQVEQRLMQLDLAIRPFNEQLKIAKDQFEAIQGFADPALRAIDRQIAKAQEALDKGDQNAANVIKNLNVEKELLQQRVDAQQELADNAAIQLALARGSQQEERTLLEIQKARFGEIKKSTKEIAKMTQPKKAAAGAKGAKGKAGVGGVAAVGEEITDFSQTAEEDLSDVPDLLDTIGASVGEGFLEGLDPDVLAQFNANTMTLGTQLDRIGKSNPVQNIVGFFGTLPDELDRVLLQPFSNIVNGIVGLFTGDTTVDLGDFKTILEGLPQSIADWLPDLPGYLNTYLASPFINKISSIFGPLTDITNPQGIAYAISNLPGTIGDWLSELPQKLIDFLQTPFDDALGIVTGFFDSTQEGTLPFILNTFFSGVGEGTLSFILQAGLRLFAALPVGIQNTLKTMGIIIWNTFAVPIVGAINWVIDRLNEFFDRVKTVTGSVRDALATIGVDFTPLDIHINRLSDAPPGFLLAPPAILPPPMQLGAARQGGLFGAGALRTHRDEIIAAAQPFGVFSQRFVRAMDVLSNNMMNGMSGVQPITQNSQVSNIVNDNRTTNINANTQNGLSAIDIANQLAIQELLG